MVFSLPRTPTSPTTIFVIAQDLFLFRRVFVSWKHTENMGLLGLAPELVVHVLSFLDFRDVLRCELVSGSTCHSFLSTVLRFDIPSEMADHSVIGLSQSERRH